MLNQRIVEKKTFAGLLLKSDTLLISVVYSSLTWQSEIELNMLLMLNISVSYFPNKTTHCPWMITALQKQAILQPWGSWSFRDVSTHRISLGGRREGGAGSCDPPFLWQTPRPAGPPQPRFPPGAARRPAQLPSAV